MEIIIRRLYPKFLAQTGPGISRHQDSSPTQPALAESLGGRAGLKFPLLLSSSSVWDVRKAKHSCCWHYIVMPISYNLRPECSKYKNHRTRLM